MAKMQYDFLGGGGGGGGKRRNRIKYNNSTVR